MFKNAFTFILLIASTAVLAGYDDVLNAYANNTPPNNALKNEIKSLTEQAEKGSPQAQNNLGLMYHFGEGVRKNDTLAASWYTKAAQQGDANAQDNLGFLYESGAGVPQDYKLAYALYSASKTASAKKQRDKLTTQMTAKQIEQGEKLTRELGKPNNFKKALDTYLTNKN
jgi:uncharacterized protein